MDFISQMLLGICLFWVIFCFAIIHGFRGHDRRREKRRSTTWESGKNGSPTSNSRRVFQLRALHAEKKGFRLYVSGELSGCMPKRNDVVWLETEKERVPVTVVGLKQLDMPEEQKGVRVRLSLAGVPGRLSAALTGTEPPACTLTNLRKSDAAVPDSAGDRETVPQKKETELHYPIVVRSSLKEIVPSALIAAFGFAGLAVFFYGAFNAPQSETALVMLGSSFLFISAISSADLFYKLTFRLTVGEEQVEVRRWGKKTSAHINNLHYNAVLASDKSEKWTMTISNGAGGEFARITNRNLNYGEAFEAFRLAAEKRKKREADRSLFRYLSETAFCTPADITLDSENSTAAAFPKILTNRSDGTHALFLYESREEAEKDGLRVIPYSIENAAALMEQLRLDRILVWTPGRDMPKCIPVTPEYWNRLKAEFGEKDKT